MMRLTISLATFLLLGAAAYPAEDMVSGASPARGWERPKGYLAPDEYPNGASFLPPPPAPDSTALALDEELNKRTLALRGTARWDLAARDAIPNPAGVFSCALGVEISSENAPRVANLLRRSTADAGAAVTPTKMAYQRKRPFLVNGQPICTPGSEDATARDGSYPSGHTAAGWVWALILTEIAPANADAVLARGLEYGQSRAVCNVHWQSDVTQGRVAGAALVARLHANEEFRADLDSARAEITALLADGAPPDRDCDLEARALSKE